LLGLVGQERIWLSDVRFMNDPSELYFGEEVVAKIALEQFSKSTSSPAVHLVEKALLRLAAERTQRPYIFAFSLCAKGDALPQWREYADRGRGYCLKFRTRELFNLANGVLGLFRVRYFENDQTDVFVQYYNEIARDLSNLTKLELAEQDSLIREISVGLSLISAVMKSVHYESESEWRIVFVCPVKSLATIKFGARRIAIKPYIDLGYNDLFNCPDPASWCPPIESIIVGPALEPVVVDSVRLFLYGSGKEYIAVEHSKIPIRELI
jgi:Protein of unknown function (DUF2971)